MVTRPVDETGRERILPTVNGNGLKRYTARQGERPRRGLEPHGRHRISPAVVDRAIKVWPVVIEDVFHSQAEIDRRFTPFETVTDPRIRDRLLLAPKRAVVDEIAGGIDRI